MKLDGSLRTKVLITDHETAKVGSFRMCREGAKVCSLSSQKELVQTANVGNSMATFSNCPIWQVCLILLQGICGVQRILPQAAKSDCQKTTWRAENRSSLWKCFTIAATLCMLRSHKSQGLDFFCSSCVMSSWDKMKSNSFVATETKYSSSFPTVQPGSDSL